MAGSVILVKRTAPHDTETSSQQHVDVGAVALADAVKGELQIPRRAQAEYACRRPLN